jgi:protein disulfide-isomerase A1
LNSTPHGGKYLSNDLEIFSSSDTQILNFTFCFSGHCKKLIPEYAGAAEILGKKDPPQFVAKVDATEQKALAERFAVQGFPTLIFFK